MSEITKTLHLALLRAAKMAIAAWEAWLKAQK
jgi:hypothetical protein